MLFLHTVTHYNGSSFDSPYRHQFSNPPARSNVKIEKSQLLLFHSQVFFVLFLLFVFGENYANQSLSLPSESKSVPKIKVALSMCNQACRAYKNLPSLCFCF